MRPDRAPDTSSDLADLGRFKSFTERSTREVKKGDGRNNLFQMNLDVMSLAVLEVNWYIRGMLFNESEAYVSAYKTIGV